MVIGDQKDTETPIVNIISIIENQYNEVATGLELYNMDD